MDAFQESLHSQKILIALGSNQCFFSLLACLMPTFRQQGGILRGIAGFKQFEAGFLDQLLIDARGTEEIHTH